MFTIGVFKSIQVQVVDKNDNSPYFERSMYEAEVDEDENIGHTVLTLTANDKDECEWDIYFDMYSSINLLL